MQDRGRFGGGFSGARNLASNGELVRAVAAARELLGRLTGLMEMLLNDIRYALRLMWRSPGFTAVAVLSLALGIGASTAIYSLFYTIMLRELPVAHLEQLVELLRTTPEAPRNEIYWGWEKYERFRDGNDVFSAITGMSFDNLASVRTVGSDAENLVGGYKSEQLAAAYQELLGRFETIPGVRSASISGCTPLQGCGSGGRYLIAEGHVDPPENRRRTNVTFVGPRYFETLGIPLIAGRDFAFRDAGRTRVAIVNQAMARHYFPGVNPIGKHVATEGSGSEPAYEIIRLAGDAKAVELRDAPYPTIYFNMFQEGRLLNQFELRNHGGSGIGGRDGAPNCPGRYESGARDGGDDARGAGGFEYRSRAPHRNALRIFRLPGSGARRDGALRAAGLHGGAAD